MGTWAGRSDPVCRPETARQRPKASVLGENGQPSISRHLRKTSRIKEKAKIEKEKKSILGAAKNKYRDQKGKNARREDVASMQPRRMLKTKSTIRA